MGKKTGYHTITYRFRLYCEQKEWLVETKSIYNQVLSFYYDVLQKEPVLKNTPKLQMMRQLELLTIGAKGVGKEEIRYPIPYEKVPLYFRRAAINDAIRLFCSMQSTGEFSASPIYYKGMYRNFSADSIELKLYDGEKWRWITCQIDTCGREMPEETQMLSPVLVLRKGRAMLHVPVRREVEDVRTVEERMADMKRICAVTFPEGETIAVLVALTAEGEIVASRFIHGGKELTHRRHVLFDRIQKNRCSTGGDRTRLPPEENSSLKEKIYRISDDAAHRISREIVDFCETWKVELIIIPKYKHMQEGTAKVYRTGNGSGVLSGDNFEISYCKQTKYDWIGRRISSYLKYKSFGCGIVTTTVTTKGTSTRCHICGADHLEKTSRTDYLCPNGHRGNGYFNATVNLGRKFLKLHSPEKRKTVG